MSPRLVRALQRGGVVAEIRPDIWGIWRTSDRRGRIVGTVLGGEVDVMIVNDNLKPTSDRCTHVLTWTEAVNPLDSDLPIAAVSISNCRQPEQALLERLILDDPIVQRRRRHSRAVHLFRYDVVREGDGFLSRTRLAYVQKALSKLDYEFLVSLIIYRASKKTLARSFSLRPAAAETKGLSLLREIARVYA